jgi:hypothetical protein
MQAHTQMRNVRVCHKNNTEATRLMMAQVRATHLAAQNGDGLHVGRQGTQPVQVRGLQRSHLHNTAEHSTAQHSTAQHSTAQHSTAQHSTAQHSTAPSARSRVHTAIEALLMLTC